MKRRPFPVSPVTGQSWSTLILKFGAAVVAQKMARDHWSVTDEDFERLYQHFTINEVVELNTLIAQFVGIGRMLAVVDAKNPVCELRTGN